MRSILLILPGFLAFAASAAEPEGASDHPLIGRYEGAEITRYEVEAYDELRLPAAPIGRGDEADPSRFEALAGRLTKITYKGPAERSALELFRNYQNKLTADGFETVFECVRQNCGHDATFWSTVAEGRGMALDWNTQIYGLFRKDKAERSVWAAIHALETPASSRQKLTPMHSVTVVETQPMEADKIVLVDSSGLEDALESDGRVALYGLYFDTDKSELRTDSEPQMAEIVRFLQDNPGIEVLVVGHTDSVGGLDYNQGLSERRAAAVVGALAERGIARSRLTPVGVGMAAPVASNAAEEGRARNRRVELVRRHE